MMFGYQNFKINSLSTYSKFSPSYSKLITDLCDSSIFPSGIIITGPIGVGKSTLAEVIVSHFYRDNEAMYKVAIIRVDTPIDNSAPYCREILSQASRLIQIYNSRIFIMFDEAHMLSFQAQQVFLASLERESNLTVFFITSELSKLCEAIQNRCLALNVEPFKHKDHIQAFAAYVFNNLDPKIKASVEANYIKFLNTNIYSTSGRDIINAILYGDFALYETIGEVKSLSDITNYISRKSAISDKINIPNILNTIADYLLTKNCTCIKICDTCHQMTQCSACEKISTFIKLSSYINNSKSLLLLLKILQQK